MFNQFMYIDILSLCVCALVTQLSNQPCRSGEKKNGIPKGDAVFCRVFRMLHTDKVGPPRYWYLSWFLTSRTMVYGTYNYSYWGLSTNFAILGVPHCMLDVSQVISIARLSDVACYQVPPSRICEQQGPHGTAAGGAITISLTCVFGRVTFW